MTSRVLLAFWGLAIVFPSIAQQIEFISPAQTGYSAEALVEYPLTTYESVRLSVTDFQTQLANSPNEKNQQLRKSSQQVTLPLPDGTARTFLAVESSVMQPELQARWPQIRTYKILDAQDDHFTGRLAVTPQGISGVYETATGVAYLEPYAADDNQNHLVYYQKDTDASHLPSQQFACGYVAEEAALHSTPEAFKPPHVGTTHLLKSETAYIREYILALTCTGEYGQQKGGTIESVLTSFVMAMNVANLTFEREVGVKIILIANVENLIFLNPTTDPFINADEGRELLGQVRPALISQGVQSVAYDLGHVFTGGCTDVGGVVNGAVCTSGKDRGVTCHYLSNVTAIVNRVFTHEVAHQFATDHSWANCPSSLDQLVTGSAFEPGSGSTIMSYAGSCGNQNIVGNNDTYYHGHSAQQFIEYTREGQANLCATEIETSNTNPKLTIPIEGGFHIPISTPFELVAGAVDNENDNLTYCWEQMDLGPITPLGEPVGNAPIFRSFPPNPNPNRVFPQMPLIVNNESDNREVLPTYSRDLTFRCMVRDNNPEIGATVWEDIAFRATETAGPFLVLSPNVGDEVWATGDFREITWDVANTTNDLVDCQQVDILLSTDGGFTYDYTLLEGTYNDGSAFVSIPNVTGNDMRIRVQATNNVFFDISNEDFTIETATEPGYTLTTGAQYWDICGPDIITIPVSTTSVLSYAENIDFSVANSLPAGVDVSFSESSISADGMTTMTIDMTNLEDFNDLFEVALTATAPGQADRNVSFFFSVTDTDFSDLALVAPVDGLTDVNLGVDFDWDPVYNGLTYDWEVATDAAFNNVVDSEYGLTETATFPSIQFENNTLYYWRVRASNSCGAGEWQRPRVFHTKVLICNEVQAADVPVTIPGTGPLPTVRSEVFVASEGTVSDVDVSRISVSYQPIQNFQVTLISPELTEVKLYDSECATTDIVSAGFDDEAPDEIICPPNGNFIFRPSEPLSLFDGENTEGVWTLEVKVIESGFGSPGQIGNWGLAFCAEGNPVAPAQVNNDTLFVPPNEANPITNDLLRVTDNNQVGPELVYTLVSVPEHGTLFRSTGELSVGMSFTQETIDAFNLTYLNTNPDAVHDGFAFVVEDGTGGFLPVEDFNIKIEDGAPVNTTEVRVDNFQVFPNPTTERITVRLAEPAAETLPIRILNVRGQVVQQSTLGTGVLQQELDLERLPASVYLVEIGGRSVRVVKQ
ncbi:MAG: reprolysin-like metallopeptidase [Bacteroidota bacterium]